VVFIVVAVGAGRGLLVGLLMRPGNVWSLIGGAVLLLGCIAVLLASGMLTGRRHRGR
jgi:hypothetical protein